MTERSVIHASFCIERTYPAAPARVFAAFAEADAKARWFGGPPEWEKIDRAFDFRVGGEERSAARLPDGTVTAFRSRYEDIVPNARIVYSYGMRLNDVPISVSLTTVELSAAGEGTRLVFTEQGAFLDGYDDAGRREEGTRGLLDALGASLTD
jgi:uncharacterized protein YndB with AHSA1/START domain